MTPTTKLAICTGLAAALLGPAAAAQNGTVAYPQLSVNTSQGINAPLGYTNIPTLANTFEEARVQQLIPARFLPTVPTFVNGITFHPTTTGPVTYTQLTVTMSLANLSGLSGVFANNLPSPITVYNQQNVTLNFTSKVPFTIPFPTPFVLDGASDLVIEIQKDAVVDPNVAGSRGGVQLAQRPSRSDLPIPYYNQGNAGSGAWQAASATGASSQVVKLRLEISDIGGQPLDFLNLRNDLPSGIKDIFTGGSNLDVEIDTDVGSFYWVFLSQGFNTNPLKVGSVRGEAWLNPLTAQQLFQGIAIQDPQVISTVIPTNPNLVGVLFGAQAVVFNPFRGNAMFTNPVGAVVN